MINIKKTIIFFALFSLTFFAFCEKSFIYISPNNDGVQDMLEIPLKIREKRYIKEWALIIEDENENIVRTIGNKEKRPERITFKTFFKQLVSKKSGVAVPSFVVWNGRTDFGEIAPDGKYFYSVSASDDNGNSSSTAKFTVFVDNTPPEIILEQPTENEKIFGEGEKSSILLRQKGTSEDLWIGQFSDANGKIVRTKTFEGEPVDFLWDGTGDDGFFVPDGIYNYRIFSTDRAGNPSNSVAVTNIIYSSEKPVINVAIEGSPYFSPNVDKYDSNENTNSVSLKLTLPAPDARSANKLISWKLSFLDQSGKEIDSKIGAEDFPEKIMWNGVSGKKLSDGEYKAVLTAKYKNGYEPPPATSPVFVLDTIAPEATISVSEKTFSPDGDGNQDTVQIAQIFKANTGSPIKNWKGEIISENNEVVFENDFGEYPPEKFVWDGISTFGTIAPDASYRYILSAKDAAGNESIIRSTPFALDTSKSEVILVASLVAFSPNADGIQDTITFSPSIKKGGEIDKYEFWISNQDGNEVFKKSENSSLPQNFVWDGKSSSGKKCQDGKYTAYLKTIAKNGSEANAKTRQFDLDTVPPNCVAKIPYKIFSADGDGKKDVLPFEINSSEEEKWSATCTNEKGEIVKTWNWKGKIPNFLWDGSDEAGNKAENGKYKIEFYAKDVAGNSFRTQIDEIVLDNREVKAYITASTDAISPNDDGFRDDIQFSVRVTPNDGIENYKIEVLSPEGEIAKTWSGSKILDSGATFLWDGKSEKKDSNGKNLPCEGVFSAKLKIVYEKGNVAEVSSSPFISSVTPPELSVNITPDYFSPDNDGEDDDLFIKLKGSSSVALNSWSFVVKDPYEKPFWSVSGRSTITPQLVWDGRGINGELVQSAMDYPFIFEAKDELGLSNSIHGKIGVDVLLIRDGDVLKMAVPSIIFRSDAADFKTSEEIPGSKVTKEQAENNERVLKRISQILNKFKDYTVTIEGHANNVSGTEEEETSLKNGNIPLEPLSKERAEFVKSRLKSYGVDQNRMTAVGRGGRKPVVPRSDKDNWWKNRRVEFILNK